MSVCEPLKIGLGYEDFLSRFAAGIVGRCWPSNPGQKSPGATAGDVKALPKYTSSPLHRALKQKQEGAPYMDLQNAYLASSAEWERTVGLHRQRFLDVRAAISPTCIVIHRSSTCIVLNRILWLCLSDTMLVCLPLQTAVSTRVALLLYAVFLMLLEGRRPSSIAVALKDEVLGLMLLLGVGGGDRMATLA